jgi:hypothetical protein
MRLVYEASGTEVKVGDFVYIGDDRYTVMYFAKPHKPASSGKVTVRHPYDDVGWGEEYYVNVIGAKWIEREDR